MNDVGYKANQSKVDSFSVKLSDKMNPLLIRQNMTLDYLGYVTWLHKLDTDVRIANQKKYIRVGLRSTPSTRSNFGTLGQSYSSKLGGSCSVF